MAKWRKGLWLIRSSITKNSALRRTLPSIEAQQAALFYKCIRETMDAVIFIATQGGLIGLAAPSTQQGGLIAIVNGSAYPFAVRPVQGAGFYLLVGPCYIHGIMNGVQYGGQSGEGNTATVAIQKSHQNLCGQFERTDQPLRLSCLLVIHLIRVLSEQSGE
jgi:hypothetical protein